VSAMWPDKDMRTVRVLASEPLYHFFYPAGRPRLAKEHATVRSQNADVEVIAGHRCELSSDLATGDVGGHRRSTAFDSGGAKARCWRCLCFPRESCSLLCPPFFAEVAGGTAASASPGSDLASELGVQDLGSGIRITRRGGAWSCADSCFRSIRGRPGCLQTLVRFESSFDAPVVSSERSHGFVADGLHHAGDGLDDRAGDECRFKSLVERKSGRAADNAGRSRGNHGRYDCEDDAVGHKIQK
jgi:hypothetical protein